MSLTETQCTEFLARAHHLHAQMRRQKGSKFERKSRQENSVAYIAAAFAFRSLQMASAVDGSNSLKCTRTDMARLFCKSELSNSGSGKVANWEALIEEFEAQEANRSNDLVNGRPADGERLLEDDRHLAFGHDEVDEALEQLEMEDALNEGMVTDDAMGESDLSAVLCEALPAYLIDSLHQAIRLPAPVVPILAHLLQDEHPADNFGLRRYFEEKLVVLMQQLRPVDVSHTAIGMLCHPECTKEMIAKMRAFDQTLTACADDGMVIIGLSLNIERGIFEASPKLAPKLAAGLLLRILSAASTVEPAVLDGYDSLKRLLARVVRSPRSPRPSPTGGGGSGNEDGGAIEPVSLGATTQDEAICEGGWLGASVTPQEPPGEESESALSARPKAWVPPEQLVETEQLGDAAEHEWLDVGDEIDDQSVTPSPVTDVLATPDAPSAAPPPHSSISSSTAALVHQWSGAHSAGVSTINRLATPTGSSLLDAANEGERLPSCAAPIDESRLELNMADKAASCIGKGAFSVVLRGKLGKQPVAVKILNGYYFDQEMKVRFLKEAALLQIAARGCSRVCRFFGTVVLDDQPAIVMKLYPRSLRDVLQAAPSRRLQESLAVDYAYQLACALVELHDLTPAVLVLDLKPANLLLDCNGLLHVADFGVSKVLNETATLGATLDSVRGGTPYYMAPEQLNEGDAVGKPADVYAFAAVVYEMCVGEPPHASSTEGRPLNMVQILKKVCIDKALPAALMADAPLFSTTLAVLERRCLAFDPSARPTATDVRDGTIQVKMRAPVIMEALEERRRGYDTGTRDAELRDEALRCAGEVEQGVPASAWPWMVDLEQHLRQCLAAPRREAFATMRANSAHFVCDPGIASAITELEAIQAAKDDEVVARYQKRCEAFNVALYQRLADQASRQTATTVAAIESLSNDPYDEQHRLNQMLRSFDVSDPGGVNSGSLEGEYYLTCRGPMLLPEDSAMVQLVALKSVLAEELARSRQARFEALQKRSKSGFAKLNIRQCPKCKRGWSDAGGCQWRMCGAPYVSKNEMQLDENNDLVFSISEKKFNDDGEVVDSKPTVQVERFFGVRRSEPFGTMHPKENPATISERFLKMWQVTYDSSKLHHGCGYVGWFSDWKPVDFDDL